MEIQPPNFLDVNWGGSEFHMQSSEAEKGFSGEIYVNQERKNLEKKPCLSLSLRLLIPAYIQTSLPNKAPAPKSAEFQCLKHHFLGADKWLRFLFND